MDATTNFCSRSVAATGRRHLGHRPVDANRWCYFIFLTRLWLLLAGDLSVLARLILFFYFLTQLWLLLAGDTSVLARLILLYHAELLCDYIKLIYILWTNARRCLMAENQTE